MVMAEIKRNLKTLSRPEKFYLIQFIATELAQEETELSHYFKADSQHAIWSQYNAFEAAQSLQTLLENNKA
jgi:hypothetical protein